MVRQNAKCYIISSSVPSFFKNTFVINMTVNSHFNVLLLLLFVGAGSGAIYC